MFLLSSIFFLLGGSFNFHVFSKKNTGFLHPNNKGVFPITVKNIKAGGLMFDDVLFENEQFDLYEEKFVSKGHHVELYLPVEIIIKNIYLGMDSTSGMDFTKEEEHEDEEVSFCKNAEN